MIVCRNNLIICYGSSTLRLNFMFGSSPPVIRLVHIIVLLLCLFSHIQTSAVLSCHLSGWEKNSETCELAVSWGQHVVFCICNGTRGSFGLTFFWFLSLCCLKRLSSLYVLFFFLFIHTADKFIGEWPQEKKGK